MHKKVVALVCITSTICCLVLGVLVGSHLHLADSTSVTSSPAPVVEIPDRRDFLFEVDGYRTKNQGGQTINLFFHYRYANGIADADIPNYEDLRKQALEYLDTVDTARNPYWETLAKTMCAKLKSDFPIEAISCQLQIFPDDRPGLPYEPGYHSTTYTIGSIEALAIPGPTTAERQ